MQYRSTRDFSVEVCAAQAIAQGICEDGGLFVPETIPTLSQADFSAMRNASYTERAEKILSLFLTDFSEAEIRSCVAQAYAAEKFPEGPAPLSVLQNGSGWIGVLELWHGPTCAFKDMALQLLPHLLTVSMQKIQADKTALILVATSGDTGKAALEGFRDVPHTKILVFYPQDGVSAMQKRQMVTQEGRNVSVCAIVGNFDDAQTGVKRLFTDSAVCAALDAHGYAFSSANSINLGRLLPQIVYYISAYCDLLADGRLQEGQAVNIVVPTGNFGNILAAYYAKRMGLPVHKLICASNQNDVLTEFLRTGVYDRNRPFYTTISPSMDILISSNLERLLSDLTGADETVRAWMRSLQETGRYEVDARTREQLTALFWAGHCSDGETLAEIRRVYEAAHYLCDPHTAVAMQVYRQYTSETGDTQTPVLLASTASPYKFADHVLEAVSGAAPQGDAFEEAQTLSRLTETPVPPQIQALQQKAVRFTDVCTPSEMSQQVLRIISEAP